MRPPKIAPVLLALPLGAASAATAQTTFINIADTGAGQFHDTPFFGFPHDAGNGPFSGSAYLFDAGTSQQFAKTLAEVVAAVDQFGNTVDTNRQGTFGCPDCHARSLSRSSAD